jgi:hypothetical protein
MQPMLETSIGAPFLVNSGDPPPPAALNHSLPSDRDPTDEIRSNRVNTGQSQAVFSKEAMGFLVINLSSYSVQE